MIQTPNSNNYNNPMNQVEYEKALARYINEAANLMKATQENISGFPS